MNEKLKPPMEIKKQFFPALMKYIINSTGHDLNGEWCTYSVSFKFKEEDGTIEFVTTDECITYYR